MDGEHLLPDGRNDSEFESSFSSSTSSVQSSSSSEFDVEAYRLQNTEHHRIVQERAYELGMEKRKNLGTKAKLSSELSVGESSNGESSNGESSNGEEEAEESDKEEHRKKNTEYHEARQLPAMKRGEEKRKEKAEREKSKYRVSASSEDSGSDGSSNRDSTKSAGGEVQKPTFNIQVVSKMEEYMKQFADQIPEEVWIKPLNRPSPKQPSYIHVPSITQKSAVQDKTKTSSEDLNGKPTEGSNKKKKSSVPQIDDYVDLHHHHAQPVTLAQVETATTSIKAQSDVQEKLVETATSQVQPINQNIETFEVIPTLPTAIFLKPVGNPEGATSIIVSEDANESAEMFLKTDSETEEANDEPKSAPLFGSANQVHRQPVIPENYIDSEYRSQPSSRQAGKTQQELKIPIVERQVPIKKGKQFPPDKQPGILARPETEVDEEEEDVVATHSEQQGRPSRIPIQLQQSTHSSQQQATNQEEPVAGPSHAIIATTSSPMPALTTASSQSNNREYEVVVPTEMSSSGKSKKKQAKLPKPYQKEQHVITQKDSDSEGEIPSPQARRKPKEIKGKTQHKRKTPIVQLQVPIKKGKLFPSGKQTDVVGRPETEVDEEEEDVVATHSEQQARPSRVLSIQQQQATTSPSNQEETVAGPSPAIIATTSSPMPALVTASLRSNNKKYEDAVPNDNSSRSKGKKQTKLPKPYQKEQHVLPQKDSETEGVIPSPQAHRNPKEVKEKTQQKRKTPIVQLQVPIKKGKQFPPDKQIDVVGPPETEVDAEEEDVVATHTEQQGRPSRISIRQQQSTYSSQQQASTTTISTNQEEPIAGPSHAIIAATSSPMPALTTASSQSNNREYVVVVPTDKSSHSKSKKQAKLSKPYQKEQHVITQKDSDSEGEVPSPQARRKPKEIKGKTQHKRKTPIVQLQVPIKKGKLFPSGKQPGILARPEIEVDEEEEDVVATHSEQQARSSRVLSIQQQQATTSPSNQEEPVAGPSYAIIATTSSPMTTLTSASSQSNNREYEVVVPTDDKSSHSKSKKQAKLPKPYQKEHHVITQKDSDSEGEVPSPQARRKPKKMKGKTQHKRKTPIVQLQVPIKKGKQFPLGKQTDDVGRPEIEVDEEVEDVVATHTEQQGRPSRISIRQQQSTYSSQQQATNQEEPVAGPSRAIIATTYSPTPALATISSQSNKKGKKTANANSGSDERDVSRTRYVGNDVFGNYHMLKDNDWRKILNEVKPDHGLNEEEIGQLGLRINHFLEDFFCYLCEETPLPYGFVTFQHLKKAMIEQCLLEENASTDDLLQEMKREFPKEDWKRGEGIVFPSRYSTNEDTGDFLFN